MQSVSARVCPVTIALLNDCVRLKDLVHKYVQGPHYAHVTRYLPSSSKPDVLDMSFPVGPCVDDRRIPFFRMMNTIRKIPTITTHITTVSMIVVRRLSCELGLSIAVVQKPDQVTHRYSKRSQILIS